MPILTMLKSWKYGFNSPFKAEVYFVNTKQFLNQRWGTSNPVMMRDNEFGMVRLRAHGIYSFSVSDPVVFLKQVFGTNAYFTVSGVTEHLKRTIASSLSDIVAQSKIPALLAFLGYIGRPGPDAVAAGALKHQAAALDGDRIVSAQGIAGGCYFEGQIAYFQVVFGFDARVSLG